MSGEFTINMENEISEDDKVIFLLSHNDKYVAINSCENVTYMMAE